MTISQTLSIEQLRNETWGCDDFWEVVEDQDLWQDVEDYLEEYWRDKFPPDIEEVNDLLRFDGDTVLEAVGA